MSGLPTIQRQVCEHVLNLAIKSKNQIRKFNEGLMCK